MKTKFVTSFYTDITNHPFYGHDTIARHHRYLHSLRTLNNMNCEIICYCNETQYELLFNYVLEQNLKFVTIKISNLIDSKYSSKLIDIKNKTNNFKFYHEVDWNKIFLLEKEFDLEYDYIYWIDVGLSHHGLFPKKFNPNHISGMSHDYNTYSFTLIFNNQLPHSLNNYCGEKLINLSNRLLFHNPIEINRIFNSNFDFSSLSVGAILGGHISKLDWFINNFDELGNKCINQNTILNHEAIISYIVKSAPQIFETFEFDNWYHEDYGNLSDETLKKLTTFANFFEKILNNK